MNQLSVLQLLFAYSSPALLKSAYILDDKNNKGGMEIYMHKSIDIPQKVLVKIYHRFLRPAGQRRRPGLSLNHSFVNAHAGDLKVETKEENLPGLLYVCPGNNL